MKISVALLLAFILFGCAAMPRTNRLQGKTSDDIEVVSTNIDTPPEPVGGMAAIQAALREPEEVLKENKEGEVIVEATINSNGRVIATKIVQSSGYPGMDSEAMLAVARVSWKPAQRRGSAVTATVRVNVVFERN
ncbi:MAG: energy transducer TonB [candidate division KSB1 bacterium]|nr:energy transducer TonB [candidate division KSB1 bacterium]MDZ7303814.1 energy transducer TonB [candidate division KSB1 bacterium]MDZ7314175.1 energy transducer TonB [candidate division KSB1 bacterium]